MQNFAQAQIRNECSTSKSNHGVLLPFPYLLLFILFLGLHQIHAVAGLEKKKRVWSIIDNVCQWLDNS